jgi:hypothetical protein
MVSAATTSTTLVAPYLYTWGIGNPAYQVSSLVDALQKANLKAATLAFIISHGGCSIGTEIDSMLSDIKTYQQKGGKLILSFGGASGRI